MVEEFAAAAEPAGGHRLFLYYAMQNAHAPLQAPYAPFSPDWPLTSGPLRAGPELLWCAFRSRYIQQCADVCNAQRRTLCAQVLLADEATGNLTASLRRHGLWDDTILVMSNDVR